MVAVESTQQVLFEMWNVAARMAPYLLFGFLMAGLISVFLSARWVERNLGGRGLAPVLKAVLLGIPLPLCSCSVIPVTASIRNHGAARGATTGFLLATPQTGVDSIAATWGMLGPVFAVFRALVALITGCVGGTIVSIVEPETAAERREKHAEDAECTDECGEAQDTEARWVRALRYGYITLPRDIGKSLAVGILVAGLIAALVPQGLFIEYLGGGFLAMLVMMAAGIPIYVCATASIPIAMGFIHLGASPGAALAFLVAGPATNAATVATVFKVLGKRTAAVYLGTVAVGALAAGLGFDAALRVLGTWGMHMEHMTHHMTIAWWQHLAAVILIVTIAASFWRGKKISRPLETIALAGAEGADNGAIQLRIKGMTCEHCSESVARGLRQTPGVSSAEVYLETGEAIVRGENLDPAALAEIVRQAGYDVAS